MIDLLIDEATPSLNDMLRKHWSSDRRLKAHWRFLVLIALARQKPAQPLSRARITITRVSPRMLDWDNCAGGTKHLTDGLRACGVIKDDTPQHIEVTVKQEKGKAGTRIQIEQLT